MRGSFEAQWGITKRTTNFRKVELALHELTQSANPDRQLDPSVEEHSRGVAILGALMVVTAGVPEAANAVAIAGLGHDFAKSKRPYLYRRPRRFSPQEKLWNQEHALGGYLMMNQLFPDATHDETMRLAKLIGLETHCQFENPNENYPSPVQINALVLSGIINTEELAKARLWTPYHAYADVTEAVTHRTDRTRAYMMDRLLSEGMEPVPAGDIAAVYNQTAEIIGSNLIRINGFSPEQAVAVALEYRSMVDEFRSVSSLAA